MNQIKTTVANWPAPPNVRALTTTRTGGVSRTPYDAFNLALHVGDDEQHVQGNRRQLATMLRLPREPRWLTQVHGTSVVADDTVGADVTADGAVTDRRGVVLAVLTADCLPVFLCDKAGTKIGLLHAGWRGLAAGIVEAGVRAMGKIGAELLAHLGPGIGPDAYEVGEDVRGAFVAHDAAAAKTFKPNGDGHWLADMYELARLRLRAVGVTAITGGEYCTYRERARFYSYRRDGRCGRMASLIWMD